MKKGTAVKQRDISDCGPACLASLAAFHGLHLPFGRIRQYAGTDRQGTNVLGLVEAAEKLGFRAKAVKAKPESLTKIPLPAIVHVIQQGNLQHFQTIFSISAKRIFIMDPADGQFHKKVLSEFLKEWTGVVIMLIPGEEFKPGNTKISPILRFWKLIMPQKRMLLQALVGAIIYTILGLLLSFYLQKIIDFVLVEGNLRLLNLMSITMMLVVVAQFIIGYFKSLIGLHTGQRLDALLITNYYTHLLRLPLRFFDSMRVGEIISRINDAVKIRLFINDIALGILINGLIICFSFSLMFFFYWKLALLMIFSIPAYSVILWINNKINREGQRRLMEAGAEWEAQMVETISAHSTMKKFGLEEYSGIKMESKLVKMLRLLYKSGWTSIATGNLSEFISRIFTVAILWIGSYYAVKRELSPGELLSFYTLMGYFHSPLLSLLGVNKYVQDALIATDRLFEIIDLETEPFSEPSVSVASELAGDIQFNHVHFRYGNGDFLLNDLNFRISSNSITGIVGESGCGKSTIVSLLQNLYTLQNGTISIGELDITHIHRKNLRQIISVVPQHIELFTGTLVENIALGEWEPDLQRVLLIAQWLGVDEFIEKLPGGYHAKVSEQGINLSGGQRQRLGIARALYRNPRILLMDEATSSLDPISEVKVQESLDRFRKQGKTIVIIAHKLATICRCDKILVMKNGRIVEEGTHFDLIDKGGHYRQWLNGYCPMN